MRICPIGMDTKDCEICDLNIEECKYDAEVEATENVEPSFHHSKNILGRRDG